MLIVDHNRKPTGRDHCDLPLFGFCAEIAECTSVPVKTWGTEGAKRHLKLTYTPNMRFWRSSLRGVTHVHESGRRDGAVQRPGALMCDDDTLQKQLAGVLGSITSPDAAGRVVTPVHSAQAHICTNLFDLLSVTHDGLVVRRLVGFQWKPFRLRISSGRSGPTHQTSGVRGRILIGYTADIGQGSPARPWRLPSRLSCSITGDRSLSIVCDLQIQA